jgi:hypothetical protein
MSVTHVHITMLLTARVTSNYNVFLPISNDVPMWLTCLKASTVRVKAFKTFFVNAEVYALAAERAESWVC